MKRKHDSALPLPANEPFPPGLEPEAPPVSQAIEIMPAPNAVEQLQRAEIDIQIATAHRFPRSIAKAKAAMVELATLDVETAAGCFYTLPARNKKTGKPIQGESIRMAEIALYGFGNIRADSRIVGNDGKNIIARAVVHDLERNVAVAIEVQRRITDKEGYLYSEDMQTLTGNAAISFALRNATFKVIPRALVRPVYEAAMKVAIGDAKTLEARRGAQIEYAAKMGIEPERVFAALGINGAEDITLEHVAQLYGFFTAIKEGEAKIDEVFPPVAKPIRKGKAEATPGDTTPPAAAPGANQPPPAPDQSPGIMGPDDEERANILVELESRAGDAPRTFKNAMQQIGLSIVNGWQQTAPTDGLRKALKLMRDNETR